jgi:hypothetical protein
LGDLLQEVMRSEAGELVVKLVRARVHRKLVFRDCLISGYIVRSIRISCRGI